VVLQLRSTRNGPDYCFARLRKRRRVARDACESSNSIAGSVGPPPSLLPQSSILGPGYTPHMRVAALLAIPGCFAAAMLFLAIPAGDWLDDSPLLLTGLPALASGLVTYGLWQRRNSGVGAAAGWALTSSVLAVLFFGLIVLGAVGIGCENTAC
jgi:hypothetical protein